MPRVAALSSKLKLEIVKSRQCGDEGKQYLNGIFKYLKNMSDAEDCTFSSELLRRKVKVGKFTQSYIFYRKHVILDIFHNVSGIQKTVCLTELLFGRVHGHVDVCDISPIRAAMRTV